MNSEPLGVRVVGEEGGGGGGGRGRGMGRGRGGGGEKKSLYT